MCYVAAIFGTSEIHMNSEMRISSFGDGWGIDPIPVDLVLRMIDKNPC